MRRTDTSSYWQETPVPHADRLERDLTVDAVVVGGGITGITAALLLKQAGQKVALIERERFAAVDTGRTTAHLTAVTDARLHDLARRFGPAAARAVWDAGCAALGQIASLVRAKEIACDFRWLPGHLHLPLADATAAKADELKREAAEAGRLGIDATYAPRIPGFGVPGVIFPRQALFHPRRYLAGLLRLIPGNGSHVFEQTEADEIAGNPVMVRCGAHRIRAGYLVMATHNPLMGKTGLIEATLFQGRLALYTSYALSATLPEGTLPEGLFWDTADPYDYLRVERGEGRELAIFGGCDHKTGQVTDTLAVFAELERKFRRYAAHPTIGHRWSGQVINPDDGLPYIGETAERQFAATGFGGNGMTFGTLGAMMAVDAMLGRKNPWQSLFDVHRRPTAGAAWTYLAENKDYPLYLLRDWLGPAETGSLESLARNEGKVLNLEGRKVAAYRDAHGKVALHSAVCTHLGCIVGWNNAEQTWDCPCHGSRFKPTGEVIAGPAEEPLAPAEVRAR